MAVPIRWQIEKNGCDAYFVKNRTSSQLHGHHHFLLTLITRGEGTQTINGKDVYFSPGYMFFLSPADFHKNTLAPGESYDYCGVKFNYEMLDSRLASLCAISSFPIALKLSDQAFSSAKEIFARLVEESANGSERLASKIYLQTMVEELVIIALREFSVCPERIESVFLNRALGYLYSHFAEDINVSTAAAYVGYTPNYFNTVFRKTVGIPFGEYLRDMRLKYAENLLRSGDLTVTEVAVESGFESPAHFSRSFSEKYGTSPREYRKGIKNSSTNSGANNK